MAKHMHRGPDRECGGNRSRLGRGTRPRPGSTSSKPPSRSDMSLDQYRADGGCSCEPANLRFWIERRGNSPMRQGCGRRRINRRIWAASRPPTQNLTASAIMHATWRLPASRYTRASIGRRGSDGRGPSVRGRAWEKRADARLAEGPGDMRRRLSHCQSRDGGSARPRAEVPHQIAGCASALFPVGAPGAIYRALWWWGKRVGPLMKAAGCRCHGRSTADSHSHMGRLRQGPG